MNVSQPDGLIKVNQNIPDSYPATFVFADDDSIRLEAVAPPGHYFANWSGGISSTYNPIIIMLDCNKSITANFDPIMHTLMIHTVGNGSVSPAAGERYPEGTVISITATPNTGWQFDGWEGDITVPDAATILLAMNTDKTITANFSEIKPGWWLVVSIIAGILIIGVIVWFLVIKKRASLHQIIPRCHSILKSGKKSTSG